MQRILKKTRRECSEAVNATSKAYKCQCGRRDGYWMIKKGLTPATIFELVTKRFWQKANSQNAIQLSSFQFMTEDDGSTAKISWDNFESGDSYISSYSKVRHDVVWPSGQGVEITKLPQYMTPFSVML
ncbi:hypothetical protein SeMB42_g01951 [Synchytrium endobioticum]|uniref:Uncharacterized protein n=1 Tax=Synchytrium endobioticum TaxID=286115 RepID=A0A507DI20_9FUNG|nr:hypothetical protein SeMB42_g01951 [Synchytrium endobioticum]